MSKSLYQIEIEFGSELRDGAGKILGKVCVKAVVHGEWRHGEFSNRECCTMVSRDASVFVNISYVRGFVNEVIKKGIKIVEIVWIVDEA